MAAHPLHPALVHFPLALLLTATLADLAGVAAACPAPRFAALLIALGLAAALPTMAAGLWDFRRLDETQVPHALRHMGAVAVAWLGYGVALYLRRDTLVSGIEPPLASVGVGLVSAVVLGFGGWLGGELVYRYGAGRNAP
jgi:uncharacterized membrane protein